MNNNLLRNSLSIVLVSVFASPAWSLTVEQGLAALEQSVSTLKIANSSLTTQLNTLQTAFNAVKKYVEGDLAGLLNLKKSVELNPAENIQHKLDRPIGGMTLI